MQTYVLRKHCASGCDFTLASCKICPLLHGKSYLFLKGKKLPLVDPQLLAQTIQLVFNLHYLRRYLASCIAETIRRTFRCGR